MMRDRHSCFFVLHQVYKHFVDLSMCFPLKVMMDIVMLYVHHYLFLMDWRKVRKTSQSRPVLLLSSSHSERQKGQIKSTRMVHVYYRPLWTTFGVICVQSDVYYFMWNQVSVFFMTLCPLNSPTSLCSILCSLSFSFVSLMRRHHLSPGIVTHQLVVLATVSMVTSHCSGLLLLRFILGSLGNVISSHCVLISSHSQFASVEGCTSVCLKVFSCWLTDKDVWRLSAMFAQSLSGPSTVQSVD